MISQVVIGSGKRRKVATIPASVQGDIHRELRRDAGKMIKDYLFGPVHLRAKSYGKR